VSFSRAGAAFMAPAGFLSVTPHPHPCPKRERVGILLAPTPLCPKRVTRAFHLFLSQPPGRRRLAFGAGEGSPPLLQMRGDGGIYCFVFLANFPFGTLLISHHRPRGASSPYYPPASSSDAPSLLSPPSAQQWVEGFLHFPGPVTFLPRSAPLTSVTCIAQCPPSSTSASLTR
jgi:hypothetical protein